MTHCNFIFKSEVNCTSFTLKILSWNSFFPLLLLHPSQYSSSAPDWRSGFQFTAGRESFSSPPSPDWLCSPTSLLCNRYRRHSGRSVKLTTHFHVLPN